MGNGSQLTSSQISTALNISFSIPLPSNRNPTLANPISDVTVDENAGDTVIDLSNVFADAEDATLSLSATSSNSGLVNASISGTDLILSYVTEQHGAAMITVTATDSGGLEVSDSFDVIVNEVVGPIGVWGTFAGTDVNGVRISAVDAAGTTFWTTTDSLGNYNLPLATGNYFVTANGTMLQQPIVTTGVVIGASPVEINFTESSSVPNGQDIVGETPSGQLWVGESTGTTLRTVYYGSRGSTVSYQHLGVADMNGDGLDDVVARANTGELVVSISLANSSFKHRSWGAFTTATTWSEIHLGDFNGDGMQDVLGRADSDGSYWLAKSNGNSFDTSYWGRFTSAVNWSDMGVGDFNGDGNDDVAARAPDGTWWAAISDGTSRLNNSFWGRWSPGVTWSDVSVGDFNGDGRDDIAGRANNAYWWVNRSSGNNYFLVESWGVWGQSATWEDVSVGDFDGDGDDDIAGRASGQWWIAKSNGVRFANSYWGAWSTSVAWSDVSIIDFNGDGKRDIVGRTSTGQWWLLGSTGSTFQGSYLATWSTGITWQSVSVGNFI
jgi:hypothetical protein